MIEEKNIRVKLVVNFDDKRTYLEVPKEVVGELEVWSDGVNLVDQVLDADDAELAEPLLDDVVREGTSTTCLAGQRQG